MKLHHSIPTIITLFFLGNIPFACADDVRPDHLLLAHPELAGWPDVIRIKEGNIQIGQDHIEAHFPKDAKGVIEIALSDGLQNWQGYEGVSFDIENPGAEKVKMQIVVESQDDTGRSLNSRRTVTLAASTRMRLPYFFTNGNAGPYWGMRGIPVYCQLSHLAFANPGTNINLERVSRVAIEPEMNEHETVLRVYEIALFKPGSDLAKLVLHPFIDAYGQYMHKDWPGKIHDDAELKQSLAHERTLLEETPCLPGMDAMDGWQEGPQLEATGWFRVEKVNGRWWFVTPEGHLFLSIGVNCVHYGDSTFIEGRDDWFAGLPDADGSLGNFWGSVSGVHSMAEAINDKGRTFNHYGCNLKRKYGEDYIAEARNMAYNRLHAWGFTTIGNWSDGDVQTLSPMPFTVTGGSGNARALEGSAGYWGKMKDVFDPAFVENTNISIAQVAADYRDNPKVVGFFVDNEMSWSGIALAALQSPADQPAREVFIALLQEQYKDIATLNEAWKSNAADWATLQMPTVPNHQCRDDCVTFEYRFARRYFETVAGALRQHAPNHLYLGCRFTPVYAPEPAVRACAEVVDVVSYNMYSRKIASDQYCDFGKPVIFGEFHFGATDRGMFHPGLQTTADQNERAASYATYIESLALHPAAIGAHWFKYSDQPTTGRTLDGENYNIGLVTIADEPYPELIDAAKGIHQRMYSLRYNTPAP